MKVIYIHPCQACHADSFQFHVGVVDVGVPYQWVCEKCGAQMEITFGDGGKTSAQRPTGRRCDRTLVLFEVCGFPAMRFIYAGCAWDGDLSGSDYFYHESTCPTNLLRCKAIFMHGIPDQHGAFRLIREVFITGPMAMDANAAMDMLAELARTHVSVEGVQSASDTPSR